MVPPPRVASSRARVIVCISTTTSQVDISHSFSLSDQQISINLVRKDWVISIKKHPLDPSVGP